MTVQKLLPCPFCGSENVKHDPADWGDGEEYGFVMCDNCGARASNVDTLPESDCVTCWNKRELNKINPTN